MVRTLSVCLGEGGEVGHKEKAGDGACSVAGSVVRICLGILCFRVSRLLEVMKILMMTMRRDKLSVGASGDDPFHLFSRKQCSLLPVLVLMLLKLSIASSTPLAVLVIYVLV